PDRAADRRLRSDMADAEAARRAGEPSVGDERDFFAGALAVKRGRRRKQRAGPLNFSVFMPAIFTIAPSGARLPLSPTTPPVGSSGLSAGRTTSWSGFHFTFFRFSAIVRPVTVRQSPCRYP